MPLFRPLPPPELEGVARAMEPLAARGGDVLIREGEPGDLFYAIADGEVTVSTAAGFTTELSHGDGFGEIALLNDTPRTATVPGEDRREPLHAHERRLPGAPSRACPTCIARRAGWSAERLAALRRRRRSSGDSPRP